MTKSELKEGYILETRNKRLCLLYSSTMLGLTEDTKLIDLKNSSFLSMISDYSEDLKCVSNSVYDIVKIYEDYKLDNVLWERKEIELTDVERVILSNIEKKYKYIARDKSDYLYTYFTKPRKSKREDCWIGYECVSLSAFNHLFQFIKWEDEKPYLISDLLER